MLDEARERSAGPYVSSSGPAGSVGVLIRPSGGPSCGQLKHRKSSASGGEGSAEALAFQGWDKGPRSWASGGRIGSEKGTVVQQSIKNELRPYLYAYMHVFGRFFSGLRTPTEEKVAP